MSLGLEVGDLSLTGNQREGAGQLTGIDVASEMIVDASEASRRQSDFFRLYEHVNLLVSASGRLEALRQAVEPANALRAAAPMWPMWPRWCPALGAPPRARTRRRRSPAVGGSTPRHRRDRRSQRNTAWR